MRTLDKPRPALIAAVLLAMAAFALAQRLVLR